MADFTITQEELEAFISLSRAGMSDSGQIQKFEQFLRAIEKRNGITRSIVVVKWQEVDSALPPGTVFPDKWPPELTARIELVTRPVARVDVEQVLTAKASKPENIMVTSDPAGVVGFQTLDAFFIT